MNQDDLKSKVIIYHDIPTNITGFFWLETNKIYIYSLVKNYKPFHDYIVGHEMRHYKNYNFNSNIIIRLLLDIYNEWHGSYLNSIDNELIKSKVEYFEVLKKVNVNKKGYSEMLNIMKKLSDKEPTKDMVIYTKIVWFFRPFSIGGIFILLVLGSILALLILYAIFGNVLFQILLN